MEYDATTLRDYFKEFPLDVRREYPRFAVKNIEQLTESLDPDQLGHIVLTVDHLLSRFHTHTGKSWTKGEYAPVFVSVGENFNRTYYCPEDPTLVFVKTKDEGSLLGADLFWLDLKALTKDCAETARRLVSLSVKLSPALKCYAQNRKRSDEFRQEQLRLENLRLEEEKKKKAKNDRAEAERKRRQQEEELKRKRREESERREDDRKNREERKE